MTNSLGPRLRYSPLEVHARCRHALHGTGPGRMQMFAMTWVMRGVFGTELATPFEYIL